ncbi:hypothetical protein [Phyllobacterium endophyticum]|uniref:hypothetical protein n=1 Tax=Phyllobacterium endophyticum TaxID=1149773 RepID=UPI00164FB586|nr:hypothetical protein [Phyllobacterium endophyticum]
MPSFLTLASLQLLRAGLIAEAKGHYGMAEKEYERIMAPSKVVPSGLDLIRIAKS